MKRYDMEVQMRKNRKRLMFRQTEITLSPTVPADDEITARRTVLERAWKQGLLVTKFNYVRGRMPG